MASITTVTPSTSSSSGITHEPKRIADYFFMVGLRDDFELIPTISLPTTTPPVFPTPEEPPRNRDALLAEENNTNDTITTTTTSDTHTVTNDPAHTTDTASTEVVGSVKSNGFEPLLQHDPHQKASSAPTSPLPPRSPPPLPLLQRQQEPLQEKPSTPSTSPLEPSISTTTILHHRSTLPVIATTSSPGGDEDGDTTTKGDDGGKSTDSSRSTRASNDLLNPDRLWSPVRHRSKSVAHFDKGRLQHSSAKSVLDDNVLLTSGPARFRLHGSTVHPMTSTTTTTITISSPWTVQGGGGITNGMNGSGSPNGSTGGGGSATTATTATTATSELTATGRFSSHRSSHNSNNNNSNSNHSVSPNSTFPSRPRRSMTVSNISTASGSSSLSSGNHHQRPSVLLHRGPTYRNMSAGTLYKAVQEGMALEKRARAASVASSGGASVTTASSVIESIPEEASSVSETTVEGDDARIQPMPTTSEERSHAVPRFPPPGRHEMQYPAEKSTALSIQDEFRNMALQTTLIRSRSKVAASASQARPSTPGLQQHYHPPSSPGSPQRLHQRQQSSTEQHSKQQVAGQDPSLSSSSSTLTNASNSTCNLTNELDSIHLGDMVLTPEVLCRYPETDWEDAEPFQPTLSMFCFPSGLSMKVSEEQPSATYHSFVLTRETGGRSYATCVTIYERPSEALRKQCELLCKKWTESHLSESEVEYVKAIKEKITRERKIRRDLREALKEEKKNGRRARQIQLKREIIDTEEKLLLLEDQMKPWRDLYLDVEDIWVPRSIGLMSAIPYHYLLRDWILGVVVACTGFLEHPGMSLYSLPLERYVKNIIHEVQLPPFGRYEVAITINNRFLYASRPAINSVPIVKNFSLFPLFRCLLAEDIVTVIEVILSEGKVIFISSHLGMLTLASESFLYLLFPLYWQGVYIPILPAALMTCLQAPVPYIIGIERKNRDLESPPDDACLVDLDKGTVEVQMPPIQIPPRQRKKLIQSLEQYAPTSAATHRQSGQGSGQQRPTKVPFGPPAYVCEAFPHSRMTLFCGVSRAPRYARRPSEMARPLSTQVVLNASANGSMSSGIGQLSMQNGVVGSGGGSGVGGISRKGSLSSLSSTQRAQPPIPGAAPQVNGQPIMASGASTLSNAGAALPKIPKVDFEKEALLESGLERRNSTRSPLSTEPPINASDARTTTKTSAATATTTTTAANGQYRRRSMSREVKHSPKSTTTISATINEVYAGGGLTQALNSQDDLQQTTAPLSHHSTSENFNKAASKKVMSPTRMKASYFDTSATRKLDINTGASVTATISNNSGYSNGTTAAERIHAATASAPVSRSNTSSSVLSTQSTFGTSASVGGGGFNPLHDSGSTLTRQTSFTSIESSTSSIFSKSPLMSYLPGLGGGGGNSSNGGAHANGTSMQASAPLSNASSTRLVGSPGSILTNNTMTSINGTAPTHHAHGISSSSTLSTTSLASSTLTSTPAGVAAAAAAASATILRTPSFTKVDEEFLAVSASDANLAAPLSQIVLEGHVLVLMSSPLTSPITSYRCGICTHGFSPSNEAYKCEACSLHAHSGCLDELLYPCVPRGFDESGVCWSVLQMWASLLKGYRNGIIAGGVAMQHYQVQQLQQQLMQSSMGPLRQGRAASSGSEDGATTASVSTRGGGGGGGSSDRLSWAGFKSWATRSASVSANPSTTSVNQTATMTNNNGLNPNPPRPSTSSTATFATSTTAFPTSTRASIILPADNMSSSAHPAPGTRSRSGTENSGFSSGTDTVAFHRDVFMKSVDKEARAFMSVFTESQIFVQFIQDRVDRSPGDPEIMFFDEVIKAKINRSRFRLGKEETKFLDDPSYGIQMTVRAVPPSGDPVHIDETRSRRFPTKLDPELLK